MLQKYFLGANSKDGFYSLYDYFPPDKESFLHIIKAGPGGGKSSFMRAIAAEAERRGMDVELILCSGDSDSLDGLYIPSLKTAWVDGTSPHSREPANYASDADYIFLSAFMKGPLSEDDKHYVNLYASAYHAEYKAAYCLLNSVYKLQEGIYSGYLSDKQKEYISRRIDSIIRRRKKQEKEYSGNLSPRFYSTISAEGNLRLGSEIQSLCKLSFRLSSSFGGDFYALEHAARKAETEGEKIIRVPSPLSPERLTALIMPEREIAFTDSSWDLPSMRNINLDSPAEDSIGRNDKRLFRKERGLSEQLMNIAYLKLAEARELHSRLEAVYRPYLDFEGLDNFTRSHMQSIFK